MDFSKNTTMRNKIIVYFIILLIIFNHILASWFVLHGTITFHTDIARDFLLVEDIAVNKNITLIGPRSGGIPGVFHGPLWLYIHLPFFLIGQGNPVVIGWFWIGLFALSTFFVYYAGKKIYSKTAGLFAALIYSSVVASSIHSLINPFGAVVFFPICFYFFYVYFSTSKLKDLIIAIFLLGMVIQFQMAFGIPILILIYTYLLIHILFKRKYKHLLALPLIIIPLSSFILFDIRHDFLQFKSAMNYLTGVENTGKTDVSIHQRATIMIQSALGMITYNKDVLTGSFLVGLLFAIWKRNKKTAFSYYLFLYLFIGYFVITLLYKGVMWGYYYVPFIGLIAIMLASLWETIDKRIFLVLFIVIYSSNTYITWQSTVTNPFDKSDSSSWKFYKEVAEQVYTDAPSEFGYYVYTNDLYGYSSRYAMNYMQRKYPGKIAKPFEKKAVTYLLIDDVGTLSTTNSKDWKTYDLKIKSKPVKKEQKNSTYVVEKYNLNQEDLAEESNPNLIHTLIFR